MSIFNKALDENLKRAVIYSEINNSLYKSIGGKRLDNKNFYEGVIAPGTVDLPVLPTSKITKDMILDYRQKEEEATYKNAAGEDVKYQETGLTGDLEEYKPLFTGKDVDIEGARKDLLAIALEGKKISLDVIKLTKVYNSLVMKDIELYNELLNTPVFKISGRTRGEIAKERANLQRKITKLEDQIKDGENEIKEIEKDKQLKAHEIAVIDANITDNEKERAIVNKKNKDIVKEYGEKFSYLNRNKISVEQQPTESDEAYIKRLKELEKYKVDPNIYKQKAINENVNKLKINLKQILKDDSKIEQIASNFRDGDDAYILNSYWSQISEYLKKYGFDVNNKDLNFLKLVDELKQAILNIKTQPFSLNTATTTKINTSNSPNIIDSTITQKKIANNILQLINLADSTTLYIKIPNKLGQTSSGKIKYSKDNIDYSDFSFQVVTKKEKENPFTEATNNFFDVIKNFNKNLLPNTVDYKRIFGDEKLQASVFAHLKKSLNDPKVGSGIKKGGGMQPIEEIKDIDRFNEEIPKVINFGKNKLLLNKLYYNNILSVKDSKMHSIEALKNQHVSDQFVKVIYNIYNNISNNEANLSDKELELFHLLLFVSGLNKKKNIDIKREDRITKLKERLLLVESQINAGNDNPVVLEEMKQIISKLYLYKAISLPNAKLYINQFNK